VGKDTTVTVRHFWCADDGTEIQDGEVKSAGLVRGEDAVGKFPRFFVAIAELGVEDMVVDADDIFVNDRAWFAKCEIQSGICCIPPDVWEVAELCFIVWNFGVAKGLTDRYQGLTSLILESERIDDFGEIVWIGVCQRKNR